MLYQENGNTVEKICDLLSVFTIGVCSVQKVPQIVNIFKVKNTNGLNLVGLFMELCSYTIMFSYNYLNGYALLSYLEYPIILIQQILLILLVTHYSCSLCNAKVLLGSFTYVLVLTSFLNRLLPREILIILAPFCTPIGASAKVVQLYEIIWMKNSESISLLTWFLSAFTNLTRIFTILLDSGDATLLLNFSVNTMLSSAIMFAAYYYKLEQRDKRLD